STPQRASHQRQAAHFPEHMQCSPTADGALAREPPSPDTHAYGYWPGRRPGNAAQAHTLAIPATCGARAERTRTGVMRARGGISARAVSDRDCEQKKFKGA